MLCSSLVIDLRLSQGLTFFSYVVAPPPLTHSHPTLQSQPQWNCTDLPAAALAVVYLHNHLSWPCFSRTWAYWSFSIWLDSEIHTQPLWSGQGHQKCFFTLVWTTRQARYSFDFSLTYPLLAFESLLTSCSSSPSLIWFLSAVVLSLSWRGSWATFSVWAGFRLTVSAAFWWPSQTSSSWQVSHIQPWRPASSGVISSRLGTYC